MSSQIKCPQQEIILLVSDNTDVVVVVRRLHYKFTMMLFYPQDMGSSSTLTASTFTAATSTASFLPTTGSSTPASSTTPTTPGYTQEVLRKSITCHMDHFTGAQRILRIIAVSFFKFGTNFLKQLIRRKKGILPQKTRGELRKCIALYNI